MLTTAETIINLTGAKIYEVTGAVNRRIERKRQTDKLTPTRGQKKNSCRYSFRSPLQENACHISVQGGFPTVTLIKMSNMHDFVAVRVLTCSIVFNTHEYAYIGPYY